MSTATAGSPESAGSSVQKKVLAEVVAGIVIGIVAYFIGYLRYEIGADVEFSAVRADYAARGLYVSGSGAARLSIAWLLSVLAIVGYGMFAWPRFGAWLTALQLVVLGAVATAQIESAMLSLPYRHLPRMLRYAIEGGAVSGIVASLGLAMLFAGAPRVRLTLRHVFAAMVFACVLFGSLKARHAKMHSDFRAEHPDWYESWLPATYPDDADWPSKREGDQGSARQREVLGVRWMGE